MPRDWEAPDEDTPLRPDRVRRLGDRPRLPAARRHRLGRPRRPARTGLSPAGRPGPDCRRCGRGVPARARAGRRWGRRGGRGAMNAGRVLSLFLIPAALIRADAAAEEAPRLEAEATRRDDGYRGIW